MTKIVLLSDLHGHLPEIPDCDLVLIAGDLTFHPNVYAEAQWFDGPFREWAKDKNVVAIAGNHDSLLESRYKHLVPPNLPFTYIRDEIYEYNGITIFGSPWTKKFFNWSFMLDEWKLERKFETIPYADILLMHSPAYGYGDVGLGGDHTGSRMLLKKVEELQPAYLVHGHIHSGYGQYKHDWTTIVNASLVDEDYKPVHDIIEIEI